MGRYSYFYSMKELIFLVEEDPEGGYSAQDVGENIFTQGETMAELKTMSGMLSTVTTIVLPNGHGQLGFTL